ncbi:MAG: hypothetical protein RL065_188, partial [Bacteroidota bacterium]
MNRNLKMKQTKRRWLVVASVIAICNLQFVGKANAQSAFTLQQAIEFAYKNSSTVKN